MRIFPERRDTRRQRFILVILLVVLLLLAPLITYVTYTRVPYAASFDYERSGVVRRFERRSAAIETYLSTATTPAQPSFVVFANTTSLPPSSSLDPRTPLLCVVVPTVKRTEGRRNYVRESVGSLLLHTADALASGDVVLAVLNGDAHPDTHTDATSLDTFIPVLNVPPVDLLSDFQQRVLLRRSSEEKEVVHYQLALQRCMETGAAYTLIVEDDTVVRPDWWKTLQPLLVDPESVLRVQPSAPSWLFIRLFYTERFDGWEIHHIPSLILWCVVCGWVVYKGIAWLIGREVRHRRGVWRALGMTVFVLGGVSTVSVPLIMGRQNVPLFAYPFGLSPEGDFRCCSQALLFPTPYVVAVVEHIHNRLRMSAATGGRLLPIDMLLNEFSVDQGLVRYLLTPSLFQHIGVESSHLQRVRRFMISHAYEKASPRGW